MIPESRPRRASAWFPWWQPVVYEIFNGPACRGDCAAVEADGWFGIEFLIHEPANRNDIKAVGVVDEEGAKTLETTLYKSIGAEVRIIRT